MSWPKIRSLAPALRLLRGLLAVWPELLSLWQLSALPQPVSLDIGQIQSSSAAAFKAADQMYGGRLRELVARQDAGLLFIGSFPHNLPFAFGAAKALRALLPDSKVFLASWQYSLFYSLSHHKQFILDHAEDFLAVFDGVVLYQDIAPLTICEIVKHLGDGQPLEGLPNVLHHAGGGPCFLEPSAAWVRGHLERSHLMPVFPYGYLGARHSATAAALALDVAPRAKRTAHVIPTLQRCYWNKCKFCGINSQSSIAEDPLLHARGAEAAALLVDLDRQGFHSAFVGREVTPRTVLESMVDELEGRELGLRWAFEGRLEPFLTPDFIRRLRAAHCQGATFGLESACARINSLYAKHEPEMPLARITEIIRLFDELGMMVHVNTIVDLPGIKGAEMEAHAAWLRARFDELRLFHFNSNMFFVHEGSELARKPGAFGVRAKPALGMSFASLLEADWSHTYAYVQPQDAPPHVGAAAVTELWEEVIGASEYLGLRLDYVHAFYNEYSGYSSLDALQGKNVFKALQSRFAPLRDVESFALALAPGVATEELATPEQRSVIVHGSTAEVSAYLEVSEQLWAHLREAIGRGVRLRDYFVEQGLPQEERRSLARLARRLMASDLLVAAPGSLDPALAVR